MKLDVEIQRVVLDTHVPTDKEFRRWASKAYQQDLPACVTVRIVEKEESQRLNMQYRQQSKPTNVLSFPLKLPADVGQNFLGDIVVCAPVVGEEALVQGKNLRAHWAHMIVHAMLHLQGYDHEEDQEATEMEALEARILQALGYSDPYVDQQDVI